MINDTHGGIIDSETDVDGDTHAIKTTTVKYW